MNDPEFSTFMDGYWKPGNEVEHPPKRPQELSPEQVARLVHAIQQTLQTHDGAYLYKHDPVFHAVVRQLENFKRSRQALPIEHFADLIKQTCEGAFRSVPHVLQLANGRAK